MSNNSTENKIPSWLQKIQENSSELELLISGGAIYGLLKLSNGFVNTLKNFKLVYDFQILNVDVLDYLGLFRFAISLLIIGFLAHLIVRAYWLSLVCLNYVFPKGINFNKLNFRKPFKVNSEIRNDLYNEIIKADKACGLILFSTISACILLIGLSFTLILFIVCLLTLAKYEEIFPAAFYLAALVGLIFPIYLFYILDLILSGSLRKIPFLSYLIYPFFKFFDILSFRFLVQKGLWKLSSNSSILKRTLLLSIFIFVAFIYTRQTNEKQSWQDEVWEFYDEEKNIYDRTSYRDDVYDGNILAKYTIQSKIISSNFIRLRIHYSSSVKRYLKNHDCSLNEVYIIKLNNNIIKDLSWSRWIKNKYEQGIEFVIPIDFLSKGENILSVYDESFVTFLDEQDEYIEDFGKEIFIPFWYDKLAANNK